MKKKHVPEALWDAERGEWVSPREASGALWRQYVERIRTLMGIPEGAAFQHYKAHCFYCGVPVFGRPMPRPYNRAWIIRSVDHVIPRSAGGPNRPANKLTACHRCNQRKSWLTVEEFREFEGVERFWGETRRVPVSGRHRTPSSTFVRDLKNSLYDAVLSPDRD